MEPNKRTSRHRGGLVPIRGTTTELTRAASLPIQILTLTPMESNQIKASLYRITLPISILQIFYFFLIFFLCFVKLVLISSLQRKLNYTLCH